MSSFLTFLERWDFLVSSRLDAFGFALYLLVFPIYHAVYPLLGRLFPNQAVKRRVDLFRRSWIEGLIERRDIVLAAQQTRNLTMVNSFLASSALILMGFTMNIMVRVPEGFEDLPHPPGWDGKLFLLLVVFTVAFAYCMTALRHLGHFVLVIGADPALVEEEMGTSAIDFYAGLINKASNRYTLGVRCFYSSFPLLLWLFDSWLFVGLTLFWGIKFVGFQDFGHVVRRSS